MDSMHIRTMLVFHADHWIPADWDKKTCQLKVKPPTTLNCKVSFREYRNISIVHAKETDDDSKKCHRLKHMFRNMLTYWEVKKEMQNDNCKTALGAER